MNKQIVMNVLAKIVADYKGSGNGNIRLKDFAFDVKSEGEFKVEELYLTWDFKDATFSKTEGEFKTSSTDTFKLTIKGLNLTHYKGSWSIGEIEINSLHELQNLSLVLPMDELKKFFLH